MLVRRNNQMGYTVVEMMIVLAVTSVIGVTAFIIVGGQQAKAEFTQGLRDFDAKLMDVANDVATGYFPEAGKNAKCEVNFSVPGSKPTFREDSTNQGSSEDCIFVGKAVHFRPDNLGSKIKIYTLAGRRTVSEGGEEVQSLAEASPVAVSAGISGNLSGFDMTEEQNILWGLEVDAVQPQGFVLVFVTTFANISAGQPLGSPLTDVYYLDGGGAAPKSSSEVIAALGDPANYLPLSSSFDIRLTNGKRRATVAVGANNRKLSTQVIIEP